MTIILTLQHEYGLPAQSTAAGGEENEAAEHFHAFFSLLLRQREIFTILVEIRRQRHRDLKKKGRKDKV